MSKIHVFLPDEFEEFDAIIRNARKEQGIPVEPAMPCVKQVRNQTAKTPTQKVAESQKRRRTTLSI